MAYKLTTLRHCSALMLPFLINQKQIVLYVTVLRGVVLSLLEVPFCDAGRGDSIVTPSL
jgi:hypothetical protein